MLLMCVAWFWMKFEWNLNEIWMEFEWTGGQPPCSGLACVTSLGHQLWLCMRHAYLLTMEASVPMPLDSIRVISSDSVMWPWAKRRVGAEYCTEYYEGAVHWSHYYYTALNKSHFLFCSLSLSVLFLSLFLFYSRLFFCSVLFCF